MKNKKFQILGLSLVLLISIVGCRPANTNMRNMSTQTRLNTNLNKGWTYNTPYDTNTRLNTNLSNGMVRRNTPMTYDSLRDNMYFGDGMMNNTTIPNQTAMSNRATAIASRVAALPEVNSASVVIHGNTAIVGCDVKGSTTNAVSDNLRNKIEAAVRVADKNIRNISITSDPTLNDRIRTMSTDIQSGRPISGFAREIEDILRRITAPVRR